jgi:RimJ/RimL family protein N-acetyltransferase
VPATSLTDGVVLLRPPDDADIDVITQACQDAEIEAWVSIPWPYERSHAEWFLESLVRPGWESGKDLVWSVRDVGTDRLLGMIGLHGIADGSAEIGYWIAPWGRGSAVASRAVALVVDHAFDPDGVGLVRLLWQAFVGNWRSRRVAWRAGFRVEGTLRQHTVQRAGVRRDVWIGTILRDDPREPNEPWPADAPDDGAPVRPEQPGP